MTNDSNPVTILVRVIRTERRSSEKQQVRKSLVPKTATDPKPKHHGTKAATCNRNT